MTINLYLVVRVSLMDNLDPIAEVDKVLEKNGFCWFGKYGEPLSPELKARVSTANDVAVCLLFKDDSGYVMKTYAIEEVDMAPSLKRGTYPKYYDKFMDRIGTFLKVSELKSAQPSIDDLYVHSSLNKLRNSLRKSVRGHFLCKTMR